MSIAVFVMARLLDLYMLFIFVWVLGSWFPQWRYQEWFRLVGRLVEPFLNLFRGFTFLRMGMLDLTPMAAMLVISLFKTLLLRAAGGAGF